MLFSFVAVALLASSSSVVSAAHIHAHDRRQEGSVVTAEQPSSVGGQLITTAASPTLPTQVAGLDVGAILSSIGTDQAALASASAIAASYLSGGGQGLEGLVGSATALASLLPTGLVQSATGLLVDGAKTSAAAATSGGQGGGVAVPSATASSETSSLSGGAVYTQSTSSWTVLAAALAASVAVVGLL